MGKRYRVKDSFYIGFGVKEGDVVTKVEESRYGNLYKLPERLYGKGHRAHVFDKNLNLQSDNYFYMTEEHLEEIKES